MKICRFVDAGGRVRVGYLDGEVVVPVADGEGQAGLEAVLDLAMAANADPGLRPAADGEVVALEEARLLAPVAEPPSVRDFYAFEQHVRTARSRRGLEMHPDWYELPVFYFSNPAAVLGPGDPVAAPPRSAELDYELEVACVLARGGTNLRLEDADRMGLRFTLLERTGEATFEPVVAPGLGRWQRSRPGVSALTPCTAFGGTINDPPAPSVAVLPSIVTSNSPSAM